LWFVTISFQLCFGICHYDDPEELGGTEFKQDTSASGVVVVVVVMVVVMVMMVVVVMMMMIWMCWEIT
jgi:hypothetical protein